MQTIKSYFSLLFFRKRSEQIVRQFYIQVHAYDDIIQFVFIAIDIYAESLSAVQGNRRAGTDCGIGNAVRPAHGSRMPIT